MSTIGTYLHHAMKFLETIFFLLLLFIHHKLDSILPIIEALASDVTQTGSGKAESPGVCESMIEKIK